MIQVCCVCEHLIKDGDRVTVQVTSTYHILKSTVAYALNREDMEADSSTLRHESCEPNE
jgi:hypothetical protein